MIWGGQREEVRTILPVDIVRVRQPQIRLVDECRTLQRDAGALVRM